MYYISAGARTYTTAPAGTVTYSTGKIAINSIHITSVDVVDGAASTQIRITAIPDSKDIVALRNQILEIDFVNTSITGEVDTIAVGDSAAGTDFVPRPANPSTTSY